MDTLDAQAKEIQRLCAALENIADGRIDLRHDAQGRVMWHIAVAQLQSLAKSALNND